MKHKHKACYFCGSVANSTEHVPPKQMFKAFTCDSITVPSCEEHNSKKSNADQAIVSAFLVPINNSIGKYQYEDDVLKAVDSGKEGFAHTKRFAVDSPVFKNPPKILENLPNLAFLVPPISIHNWVKQLTAAIVWDGLKQWDSRLEWKYALAWSREWVPATGPSSISVNEFIEISQRYRLVENDLKKLKWISGWSASPRPYPRAIYYFDVCALKSDVIGFRHTFYNRYKWYVFSNSPKDVILRILERAKE